jgi:hypothetical protein
LKVASHSIIEELLCITNVNFFGSFALLDLVIHSTVLSL